MQRRRDTYSAAVLAACAACCSSCQSRSTMRRAWMPPASALMSMVGASGSSSMFCCWRGEHLDVLQKRGLDLLEHLLGHFRIVRLEVVRLAPEVMRGVLGLRRHGVEVAHRDAADAPALGCAGAGRGGTDVEPDERRRRVVDDLPAVDIAGEAADLDERRRRRLVDDPARHPHAARASARTFTAACSTSAMLPIVVSCTKARCVRSSRLSLTSCQLHCA